MAEPTLSEPLSEQRVYANLDWRWQWRGVELVHLLLGALPGMAWAVAAVFLQSFFGAPLLLLSLPIMVAGMAFLGILQYRRQPDYLVTCVRQALLPQHLCAFTPSAHRPFPVSRAELLCPPA